ncbi:MAG: lipid IV(A) 3-deoxy-D-manno-octulosonic acid transferase [Gallionella sp.]|nr:3-deoxy-D-manno-octulosonic acid transferase [Gallionella sp.]
MRFFYTLALWLLLPYIFIRLLWRARKQPEYLSHINERFGFYTHRCDKPVIWLHAVSVGETRAAQSLITKLQTAYPNHQILLTHTTPTGRATSEQLYGDSIVRAYLPYDFPFAVTSFLRYFKPQIGILMETEIWFNLIHACQQLNTPLLLLNARMSDKSAKGYARFAQLTSTALTNLSSIAAQTTDDAVRLTQLGAKDVSVMGNLKFEIDPPISSLVLGKQFREQFGTARKILLAASTREGEESLILDTLQSLHFLNTLLIIVPRHPQRFDDVAQLLEKHSITYQRRSENRPISNEVQVVLGDSMGEMFAYYAAADIAFIGGSLLPYGGQNLIEACSVGTPVIVGPHTYNFSEVTRLAVNAGAAIQMNKADELVEKLRFLLNDPSSFAAMRQQSVTFVNANRGATNKALEIIASKMPTSRE